VLGVEKTFLLSLSLGHFEKSLPLQTGEELNEMERRRFFITV
jgi:hypothetical protein